MQKPSRKTELIVWGFLGLTVLAIVAAFVRERWRKVSVAPPPVLFPVQPFTLTNQAGRAFSPSDLRGNVWIADIIFTSCAGPCPRMTGSMADLQRAIEPSAPVRFVSLTTDPERDTPQVLARYATHHGADTNRWSFLTGTKAQLRTAAVDSLKFTSVEKDPSLRESPTDLFIHSTLFLVVDKRGQVRGTFEMDDAGSAERLMATVQALVNER